MPKSDLVEDSEAMILTSMRIPKILHQGLIEKSREMGLSLSKTVGYLFDQHQKKTLVQAQPDYGLLNYLLMQEAIHHFVEGGQILIDRALEKLEPLQHPDPASRSSED